jgi:anti-sigma B factor antagonist
MAKLSAPDAFGFAVENRGHASVVKLSGELDIASIDDLRRAITIARAESAQGVIVDLRGLTFIDASGLRALLAEDAAGRNGDAPVRFIAGPRAVHRVFELTGMDDRLDWVDDEDEG